MVAAMEMFKSGSYLGAARRFGELSARVTEPAQARYMHDLAELYRAWCDQDAVDLPERVKEVRARISDPRSQLRPETARRLHEQVEFVEKLVKKDSSALLLNSYLLGEHYFRLGRYDFAALLYYRTIEKSLAEHLDRRYGGFDVGKPDYALLDPDSESLADRYGATAQEIFNSDRTVALPWRMQLIEAAIMLFVVEDPLCRAIGLPSRSGIQHLRGLAEIRNKSVLAHGDSVVSKDGCEKLQERAQLHLRAFWDQHESGPDGSDVKQRIEILRFITEA